MHAGHEHEHHQGNGASAGHNHGTPPHAAKWQTPHLPHNRARDEHHHHEADSGYGGKGFRREFYDQHRSDQFLATGARAIEAFDRAGRRLQLLRVETDSITDVGSVTPHLGGNSMRFDPLPASMVSQRRRWRFVYFDGGAARLLTLGEVRELAGA